MAKPIVEGPKTNLNVVAILEKANAIRQVGLISSFLIFSFATLEILFPLFVGHVIEIEIAPLK